jgi:hypothetical protein
MDAAISLAYVATDIDQRRLAIASNASWLSGSLLFVDATTDQWVECGADPALIGGVSLDEVGTGAGSLYPLDRREFPPFTCGAIRTTDGRMFNGPYVGTPQIGTYGVVKGADGVWRVDFNETVATRVRVVDVKNAVDTTNRPSFPGGTASPFRFNGAEITGPIGNGFVAFQFLPANAQQA